MILTFAKAMGEFGATITFVSNIPGETQTLPSAIYTFTQVPGGELGRAAADAGLDRHRHGGAHRLGGARAAGQPAHGPRMTLAVDVRHRLGAFTLDAAFESAGRLTALFGPSGSGKTSLVNLIGGLQPAGRRAASPSTGGCWSTPRRGVFVPAHRRRIGYVFQDARLFPHLTVRAEPALRPLLHARAPSATPTSARVVELLGIGHLLDRRPGLLSGGEKQRVAIGRALIASPRLMLMDEPLASLDDARKAEILPYIERLRDEAGIPIVYVSHSIAEVARLATDVVVLAAGRVVGERAGGRGAGAPRPRCRRRTATRPARWSSSTLDGAGRALRAEPAALRRRRLAGAAARRAARRPAARAGPGARRDARARAAGADQRAQRAAGDGRARSRPATAPTRWSRSTAAATGCSPASPASRSRRWSSRPGRPVFAIVKAVTFDRGNRPGPTPHGRRCGGGCRDGVSTGGATPAADGDCRMPSLSLRIDLDPDGRIGPGKVELLEQIAAFGSISAGARQMNMSYKHAWLLVEEMNRLFGKPVVAATKGGQRGGGAAAHRRSASPSSRRFRAIERAATSAAAPHIAALQAEIEAA